MHEADSVWDLVATNVPAQHVALIQPDAVAWSYADLRRLVEDLSTKLGALGLSRQDTVAVAMPDGGAGLLTQLGVMNVCGCAPLNPGLTETELRRDLQQLGVRALVCAPGNETCAQLAQELGLILIRAALEGGGCAWRCHQAACPSEAKSNGGAAILLHTSATTGRRKIVPLTRENLRAACGNTRRSLRLCAEDRLLVMARLFHAQGILSALAQWSAGGTVIMANTLDPAACAQAICDLQVTWFTCGPTLHQAMLAEFRKQPRPHAWRCVRSGGNTLTPELRDALRQQLGVPMLDMYGLSETGAVAAVPLDNPEAHGWRSVGPEIGIMSPEGQLLPPGEEGEIVVRGPSVMSGYWNDPDANRGAFWGEGSNRWFRTGDLGRLDASGTVTMAGRLKEIINRGGQKIKPSEVDHVLSLHPAVKSVASFAVPHPTLGEDVACAVVLHAGASVTATELQAFARTTLARYKVPRRVHFLPSLPLGATGKPQRLVLRQRLGTRPPAEPGADAFSGEDNLTRVERTIAEYWAGRLGCSEIRPHDDFFHLGGDSLGALAMLSEIELLLETPLPAGATERFFESPTLETLAAILASAGASPEPPPEQRSHQIRLYPLRGNGPGLEAFLIPADDEEGWYWRLLARHMGQHRRMAMLRPENGLYAPGPDLVEEAAAQIVAVLRKHRPHRPYLLGGFCLGGVIAYEAARLLEGEGERVALVLFDTPAPAEPHPVYGAKDYAQLLIQFVHKRRWRRVAGFPRMLLRRWLWLALQPTKALWRRYAGTPLMSWLRRQAEHDYFPLYRAARTRIPILHFIMGESMEAIWGKSVLAWSEKTSGKVVVVPLPGSHHSLFRETNLEVITNTIEDCLAVTLAADPAAV